jgi:GT2 family glycosyltransferase
MVLLGYRGLYVPEARAYHAWAATTGRTSTDARYYSIRNALTTMVKDMPLPLLLASLPKIVLYQSHIHSVARGDGYGSTVTRAWRSFLAQIPSTLRKRRRIMRARAISSRDFKALLLTDYPVATRFSIRWLREWLHHRVVGPAMRLAGRLK